jgi:hypothetical protein
MATDRRLLRLAPGDNVLVVRAPIAAGDVIDVEGATVTVPVRLGLGHKLAAAPIAEGERIVKYGAPIGRATAPIDVGAHVHVHNVASDYTPTYALPQGEEGEDR